MRTTISLDERDWGAVSAAIDGWLTILKLKSALNKKQIARYGRIRSLIVDQPQSEIERSPNARITGSVAKTLTPLVRAIDIADLLGIGLQNVRDLAAKGAIPGAVYLGGRTLHFDIGKVTAWIDAGGDKQPDAAAIIAKPSRAKPSSKIMPVRADIAAELRKMTGKFYAPPIKKDVVN